MRIKKPKATATKYLATEAQEQAALFQWAQLMSHKHAELSLMYAIPNAGLRGPRARSELLKTGLKAGVPDVCLPVPRGGFGACYVEMKRQGNKPRSEQAWWIDQLRDVGNCVGVIYSWEEAKAFLLYYLDLKPRTTTSN